MTTEDSDAAAHNSDWTFGDPCPDCECRRVNYTETITRKLAPDGDGGVSDYGLLHANGREVTCDDCGRHLGTEVDAETVN